MKELLKISAIEGASFSGKSTLIKELIKSVFTKQNERATLSKN